MKNLIPVLFITLLLGKVQAQSFSDPNFSVVPVISGWTEPVGAAFSRDAEKLFVWEKAGMLYVCNKSGSTYTKQTTPVLDLRNEVLNWRDHGLMGFALDPDYLSNGYIYLLYIVDRRVLMNDNSIVADAGHDATIGRLTKYRVANSGGNLVADPASRTILIGETPSTGIPVVHESHVIGSLAFAADGTLLVSTGDAASYYTMDAGSDNDTYWGKAIQDGILRPAENVGAFRSQMVNSHNGKLLRIDPTTGNGISSNPFYSAAEPRAPKSRVWAMGFRNAFRILVKPGTGSTNPSTGDIGEVYVGDVGWSTWEEFSIITGPAMNCGWPIYEGHQPNSSYNTVAASLQNQDEPNPLGGQSGCTRTHFTFRELIKDPTRDENKTINNPCNSSVVIGTNSRYVHRRPAIDYRHEQESSRVGIFNGNNPALAEIGTPQSGVAGTPFAGNCALSGVWYTGNNFPPEFKNTYLLVDHTSKWIKRITIDYTDVITRVDNFVALLGNVVSLLENPVDGTLMFVDIATNSLKKIQYGGNQPPVGKITANVNYGSSPLTVNFTGNTSFDLSPGGSISSYSWNFGGGSPATSTVANPSGIVFTDATGNPKKFVVKLTVTDNGGATDQDSIIISVNNTPPVVNITSPVKNSTYTIGGGDIVYPCTATVTDAEHSGTQLHYEWQTILRHNSHEHSEPIDTNVSTTTMISRVGCNGDNYYWLVKLKVTDAAGLSTTDSSKIFPNCGTDNIPPVVVSTTPPNAATGVNINSMVTADFSENINALTVTTTTFQLKDAGNNVIPAQVTASTNKINLTPSAPLGGGTVYTATAKGGSSGIKDPAGNSLAGDYSWSFTTVTVDNISPTVTSVSPSNGATGVSTGTTIIVNFSEAINASTATSSTFQLRDAGSNLIAAIISVSGNQVTLTPTTLLAGLSQYTITITGGSSGVKDVAGNSLVSNYSSGFTTASIDLIAPTVSLVSPASGSSGISVSTNVTATFSEGINPLTVTTSTFQLRNSANTLISSTVTGSGNQITLTPSAALANSVVYTATITGGASGVKDLAGNALVNNYIWSFTTVAGGSTTYNIWPPTATPAEPFNNDGQGIALGVKFRSSQNGFINGIRYYKGAGTTGTHTGHLWTSTGTLLGSTTFTGETASGWQQALFTSPIAITANTIYVASIFSPSGHYAATDPYFTAAVVNGPLTALATGESPNGLYRYTSTNAFPNSSFNASNYWVDVVFAAGSTNVPPTVTTQPASQTRCAGANAIFTSAANGTPTPTVQWQSSTNGTTWTNITGATNPTLTFAVTAADNAKQYRAVWSNSAGTVNSNAAVLTVNAIPALSSSLTANATSGTVFTYTPTSSTTGTTFAWSRSAVAGISNTAANGTGSISETLLNTTSLPVNVTYVYTLTAAGCSNTQNVVVTVSPGVVTLSPSITTQPASQTKCAGENVSFASAANGTPTPTVQWQSSTNGTTWTNVTGATNTVLTFVATAADNNKQYRAVWSNSAGTVNSNAAILTVNTIPALSSSLTATATSGTVFNYTPTSGTTGTAFAWSRSAVAGISNAAATGTGNISETLVNTTTSPVNVTYVYTLTVNSCTNTQNVVVTVNPVVTVPPSITTQPASQTKCAGENVNLTSAANGTPTPTVQWQSSTNGTTWTNITGATNAAMTFAAAAADNNKQYRAVWSNSAGTVNSNAAILTVNAIPALSSSLTATVTSGTVFNYIPASSTPGTTFGWSRSAVTGISNAAASGTGNISETLVNTTTSPVNVTYVYTLTANGCSNSQNVVVTVDPEGVTVPPSITTQPASQTKCAGENVTFISAASGIPSPTVQWQSSTNGTTWTNITGATSATLTFPVAAADNNKQYRAEWSNSAGTVNSGAAILAVNPIPATPVVTVTNNCGNSVLTATGTTGTLLWSTGATITSITVTSVGAYTVTQTVNGCPSAAGSGTAVPKQIPTLSSNLTASVTSGTMFNYTPSSSTAGTTFAWSRAVVTGISNSAATGTGNVSETLVNTTTAAVNVTYVYTLSAAGCTSTQNVIVTVNPDASIGLPSITTQPASQTRCVGASASFTSAANGTPTPTVQWQSSTNGTTWTNITGATNAVLTFAVTAADNAKQYRAIWSNSAGSVNSNAAVLTVNAVPTLSSNLSVTAISGTIFNYTPASSTSGTTFAWNRAAVTGISNAAASGTGNISETLVNTTTSPVNVTYVYTLTAAGCSNIQNVVVTVNPASAINCVINGSIVSNFNSTSIPAGRYIWFSSVIDRGSFGGISGTVTFTVTNSIITFTANSQQYTLNVPNSRIRFDAAVTSASTQFINGMWETAVPRSYSGYVFMGGLAYQVLASLPGNISNVRWTANISIDKVGVRPTWKWAAAVYTSFAAHSGLNIKPKNGSTQNPYPNNNNAGTPENFKSSVVSGAKGSGGSNYTGSYSSTSTATCAVTPGQRSTAEPLITRQGLPKKLPSLPIDVLESEELEVNAVPNPSNNIFNLIIKGNNKSYVRVRVTDVFGRTVELHDKVSVNTTLQIGQRLRGGTYFVEVTQAGQRKFIKIIKAN